MVASEPSFSAQDPGTLPSGKFLSCLGKFEPGLCYLQMTNPDGHRARIDPGPDVRRQSPSCRLSEFVQAAAHTENRVWTEPADPPDPTWVPLAL